MFQYIFCFTFWPGAIWRSFATWGHWGTGRQLRHLICRAGSQPLFERLWVESLPFHLGEEKAKRLPWRSSGSKGTSTSPMSRTRTSSRGHADDGDGKQTVAHIHLNDHRHRRRRPQHHHRRRRRRCRRHHRPQYIFCFTFWPGAIWRSFATSPGADVNNT